MKKKIHPSRARPKDYGEYHYTIKEYAMTYGGYLLAVSGLLYLFYRTAWVIPAAVLVAVHFTKKKKEILMAQHCWELNLQFKEALLSMAAALEAGYSVENSVAEALVDLKLLYPEESDIIREMSLLLRKIKMNVPMEEALYDFGERSHVEDIESFAQIFIIARRTGGNLVKIMNHTKTVIAGKIEVKREIRTMIAGKRLETKIMSIIPAGILCYLKLFSPGYLDVLYGNPAGILFMSIMLGIYLAAMHAIGSIMEVEV